MVKIIPLLTLIVFTLGSVYSYAEYPQVKTDQPGNVDKAGALEDLETDRIYREYYASQGMAQAVEAGVAFRGAIDANRATADGIAQARAKYMQGATPELDADGNPGRCYKYTNTSAVGSSTGKLDLVPCNAAAIQQTGSQDAGPTYSTETKGLESTTPSANVGLVLQNRPYTPPPKGN